MGASSGFVALTLPPADLSPAELAAETAADCLGWMGGGLACTAARGDPLLTSTSLATAGTAGVDTRKLD